MPKATRHSLTLSSGERLSFLRAGDPARPPVLLLHGFPSSANTFRDIIPVLSEIADVIAPDLPGFGQSDILSATSFQAFAAAISELLDQLSIGPRYIYLHDFGAPVGLQIAMQAPAQVRGLIIQNANAHESGFGPAWADTRAFWREPNSTNKAKATAHLSAEGTRDQYVANVPDDVAAHIDPAIWEEDWRVMNLPGRMETQVALIADYGNYTARFAAIADYLAREQPPALLLWGRHDSFFALPETVSWMESLPRMEAHILDGGHFLLETHAGRCGALMRDFIVAADPHGS
jgi:pimeloyl-ACP methyl ester carboxylesterase